MSRAISFLYYTCGHASPVRGKSAYVPWPCPACAKHVHVCYDCATATFSNIPQSEARDQTTPKIDHASR